MKKLATIIFIALLSGGSIFAENIIVGLDTGLSITLEDTSTFTDADFSVIQVGVPVMLHALYQLDQSFEIPELGASTISIGLKAGYLPLFLATNDNFFGSEVTFNMFTVPVLPYAKINAGDFYIGLGLGVHAWFYNATVDSKYDDSFGDNGIEFCALIEPGYTYSLTDDLDLNAGLSIFNTTYESGSSKNDSFVIVLNIGAEYSL